MPPTVQEVKEYPGLDIPRGTVPSTSYWGNFISQLTGLFRENGHAINRMLLRWSHTTKDQITANQNNYVLGDGVFFRLSSDASRNITGIKADGDSLLKILVNIGAQDIVLQHQNASSDDANKILADTGADLTLGADKFALLWYDVTTARWRGLLL